MALGDQLVITLIEAKLFLRIEHNDEDDLVNELILTALDDAEGYLGTDFSADDETVPAALKHHIKRWIAYLYTQRHPGITQERIVDTTTTYEDPVADFQSALSRWRRNPGL